jgi:transcriptional regulator with XRE-family HTH domain
MKRFGEKLRTLRERQGLSQRQLSDMLGVHQSHLWRMEQGKKTPNVAMVLKVADIFGVTTDQLIRDEIELD